MLVQLTPQAGVDRAAFRKQAEAQGLVVEGVDSDTGTLEGYLPLAAVNDLAALKGTGTIAQAVQPVTRIGKATSQGVALQRVDKVHGKGIDGKGITIGVLSDSYDAAKFTTWATPLKIHAAQDVKSGDLPGKGNAAYPSPVVVLEDADDDGTGASTRAGRCSRSSTTSRRRRSSASPRRGTARPASPTTSASWPTRRASAAPTSIVDDVVYFDEPMFSDGMVGDAIDDVAAKGVHYFTAAGNDGEDVAWNSQVQLIPAKTGLKGTNLDFSEVDPALYDGGLQDMNPGSGTDVAQAILLRRRPGGAQFDFQWNDPFDVDGATYGPSLFTATGELTTPTSTKTYTFNATVVGRRQAARVPHRRRPVRHHRPGAVRDRPRRQQHRRDRHRHLAGELRDDHQEGGRLQDHGHRLRR